MVAARGKIRVQQRIAQPRSLKTLNRGDRNSGIGGYSQENGKNSDVLDPGEHMLLQYRTFREPGAVPGRSIWEILA